MALEDGTVSTESSDQTKASEPGKLARTGPAEVHGSSASSSHGAPSVSSDPGTPPCAWTQPTARKGAALSQFPGLKPPSTTSAGLRRKLLVLGKSDGEPQT